MAANAPVHGLLLVDKPRGLSSHDVVMRARRALQTRRIGHTGTLDPMATGLLVLAIGEATKLVAYLTEHDKRYTCTVQLGAATESLDADGAITERARVPLLHASAIDAACRALQAETLQIPPMVSALKVDGERLYQRARRGEVVEVAPRAVTLHALEATAVRDEQIDLTVHCGKGFYVRSMARDLAVLLGTVGHLTSLRRTHVGVDDVASAVPGTLLDQASRGDAAARAEVSARVIGMNAACARMPQVTLTAAGVDHASHGRAFSVEHLAGPWPSLGGAAILVDESALPLAIARATDGVVTIARGFVRETMVSSTVVDQRGSTST